MSTIEETSVSVNNKMTTENIKNNKYKSMLISGNIITENKSSTNLINLDLFLENDKKNNINEQWSKLDKTVKLKKMILFSESFAKENNLTPEEKDNLLLFLKDCLDKKKLIRVKDVIYDKTLGVIKEIPALHKLPDRFTLKNIDKRISTLKNLPPPKKTDTITIN
jgi:hypothetical protein